MARPLSCRTSPTYLRSPGKTTTVNGQVSKVSQKSRKVTPLLPSFTWKTVPLMHCVFPTCWCASEKGTHSADTWMVAITGTASVSIRTTLEQVIPNWRGILPVAVIVGGTAIVEADGGRKVGDSVPKREGTAGVVVPPAHSRIEERRAATCRRPSPHSPRRP